MKKINGIVIVMCMLFLSTTNAQVSVNVNIGSPPLWGPVGYTEVQYYYLPDVEAYYDIQTSLFIYSSGGIWIHRAFLPTRYRYYDLYSGYKVVLTDYHGHEPYTHFHNHKVKYYKGYKGGNQKTIGEKPGKGNNKLSSPSNTSGQKKSSPNKTNSGGQKKDNGSYSNEKKGGGGNGNQKSSPGGGGKSNSKGGGHGGGGKKK